MVITTLRRVVRAPPGELPCSPHRRPNQPAVLDSLGAQPTLAHERPSLIRSTRRRPHRPEATSTGCSADRPCHVLTISHAPTDRARAPQVRHTSPPFIFTSKSIFLSVFPAPSPPPSGFSISECLDEIDRIQTVVQPVGLTVELPSTTHSPMPARTWIGRNPGRTLLGAPQGLRRRRTRRYAA